MEIGDLEYRVEGDLGGPGPVRPSAHALARQSLPDRLLSLQGGVGPTRSRRVSSQVFIPWRKEGDYTPTVTVTPPRSGIRS